MIAFSAIGGCLLGVISPGPMTAAALEAGSRNRWAGFGFAAGHAIVEGPVIVLIIFGVGPLFKRPETELAFGLMGGFVMLGLGLLQIRALLSMRSNGTASDAQEPEPSHTRGHSVEASVEKLRNPLVEGVLFTLASPFFFVWWTTGGLALIDIVMDAGTLCLAIFLLGHWLSDLIWLTVLSIFSYGGTKLMGGGWYSGVLALCAVTLIGFGGYFLFDSINGLMFF